MTAIPDLTGSPCTQPGANPEDWHPHPRDHPTRARAVAACRACGARTACLAYALDSDQREGIWGGLGPAERNRLRERSGLTVLPLPSTLAASVRRSA